MGAGLQQVCQKNASETPRTGHALCGKVSVPGDKAKGAGSGCITSHSAATVGVALPAELPADLPVAEPVGGGGGSHPRARGTRCRLGHQPARFGPSRLERRALSIPLPVGNDKAWPVDWQWALHRWLVDLRRCGPRRCHQACQRRHRDHRDPARRSALRGVVEPLHSERKL